MLGSSAARSLPSVARGVSARGFATTRARNTHVAVLGAGGQPIFSSLTPKKCSPLVFLQAVLDSPSRSCSSSTGSSLTCVFTTSGVHPVLLPTCECEADHLSFFAHLLTVPCISSHVNTPAKTVGYGPDNDGLKKTLDGVEVILIPAGVPRKPGMSRDDLFNVHRFFSISGKHLSLTRTLQTDQRLHRPRLGQGRCRGRAQGKDPRHR
jgi:hypothetical protein